EAAAPPEGLARRAGPDPDVPRDRRADPERAVPGALRQASRLRRRGEVARGAGLPRGDAATGLRLLERQARAPVEADRPLVRRRLPQRLHGRAPDAPRAEVAGRPEPRGGKPDAGLGHAA